MHFDMFIKVRKRMTRYTGKIYGIFRTLRASVVDPHHTDADPDANPDSDFYLMRILMRIRIRRFTLRIRIQILTSK